MARTACWRMKDGELVEKVVDGTEVPEGWYDNPRLQPNTPQPLPGDIEIVVEPEIVAEPELVSEPEVVEVIVDVVDEQVSEPEPEQASEDQPGGEEATE